MASPRRFASASGRDEPHADRFAAKAGRVERSGAQGSGRGADRRVGEPGGNGGVRGLSTDLTERPGLPGPDVSLRSHSQQLPGGDRPRELEWDVGGSRLARLHDRSSRHGDRVHRGRHQLAGFVGAGSGQPRLPEPGRAADTVRRRAVHVFLRSAGRELRPEPRRRIQRAGLRPRPAGERPQRERLPRSRGPDREILRRSGPRQQRLRERHLGLGLLQPPERPGHCRRRVLALGQSDAASRGAGQQRHPRCRRVSQLHDSPGQGGRRSARSHRRSRAGVAVRRRLRARRSSCR